jgi:hypothetical protein
MTAAYANVSDGFKPAVTGMATRAEAPATAQASAIHQGTVTPYATRISPMGW